MKKIRLPIEAETRLLLVLPKFSEFRDEAEEYGANARLCMGLLKEADTIRKSSAHTCPPPAWKSCSCPHCQWCKAAVQIVLEHITESERLAYSILVTLLEEGENERARETTRVETTKANC